MQIGLVGGYLKSRRCSFISNLLGLSCQNYKFVRLILLRWTNFDLPGVSRLRRYDFYRFFSLPYRDNPSPTTRTLLLYFPAYWYPLSGPPTLPPKRLLRNTVVGLKSSHSLTCAYFLPFLSHNSTIISYHLEGFALLIYLLICSNSIQLRMEN